MFQGTTAEYRISYMFFAATDEMGPSVGVSGVHFLPFASIAPEPGVDVLGQDMADYTLAGSHEHAVGQLAHEPGLRLTLVCTSRNGFGHDVRLHKR